LLAAGIRSGSARRPGINQILKAMTATRRPLGEVVHVRRVRPGDGPGCAQAWLDAARYYTDLDPDSFQVPDESGLTEWFEQQNARSNPGIATLVATVGSEVAGFAVAEFQAPMADAHRQMVKAAGQSRVYVNALVVAEQFRRAGVGTALMEAVERWALDRGAELVSLDTNLRSPLSVPFYEDRMRYARHAVIFRKLLAP